MGETTIKTLAVLPFINMSGREDIEYFSDGITEEIIHALAGIEHLRVTSRTSSFFFKGKQNTHWTNSQRPQCCRSTGRQRTPCVHNHPDICPVDSCPGRFSFLGLAYESGFNSQTVFNTYFKRETNLTPRQFLKS